MGCLAVLPHHLLKVYGCIVWQRQACPERSRREVKSMDRKVVVSHPLRDNKVIQWLPPVALPPLFNVGIGLIILLAAQLIPFRLKR
jgi:hypothetical protein